MTMGYLPPRLPASCLSMAPRFDTKHNASIVARRNPLSEVNTQNQIIGEVREDFLYLKFRAL
jgi:polo-like kinase 1